MFNIGGRDLSQPLLTKRGKRYLGLISDSYHVPLKHIVYSHYGDTLKPIKVPLNLNFLASFDEVCRGQFKDVKFILKLLG
jgi:hypothetical protein